MTKFIVVSRLALKLPISALASPAASPRNERRFLGKRHDAFKDFISIPHFEGDLEPSKVPTGIEAHTVAKPTLDLAKLTWLLKSDLRRP